MNDHLQSEPELYCPDCGYDLRGIESARCPECGVAIDRGGIGQSAIPWVHRGQIGRWRAFWRTVWMTTRHPGRLAREVARPVSYREAQRFRWVVIAAAFVPLCAAVMFARHADLDGLTRLAQDELSPFWSQPQSLRSDAIVCFVMGVQMWWVLPIMVFIWATCATGMAGYFFHPSSLAMARQNRALALSQYACGPLAWLLAASVFFAAARVLIAADTGRAGPAFMVQAALLIVVGFIVVAAVFCWWFGTLRVLKLLTHCTFGRVLAAAVMLPLGWIVLGAICFVVLPGIAGYVRLIIHSLLR